jgi:hypothetical protein
MRKSEWSRSTSGKIQIQNESWTLSAVDSEEVTEIYKATNYIGIQNKLISAETDPWQSLSNGLRWSKVKRGTVRQKRGPTFSDISGERVSRHQPKWYDDNEMEFDNTGRFNFMQWIGQIHFTPDCLMHLRQFLYKIER